MGIPEKKKENWPESYVKKECSKTFKFREGYGPLLQEAQQSPKQNKTKQKR